MNLEKQLRIASHLAKSEHVIYKLREQKELDPDEKSWVLNLFCMNNATKDSGKISFLLYSDNKNEAQNLWSLSNRIEDKELLSKEDWNFILNGCLRYRRHLVSKSHIGCNCE